MQSVSESLAGRAEILELEGLTCAEIRDALPHVTLEQALLRGGFPELYDAPKLDSAGFYRSYVATYLERDLRQQLMVGNLRDFERFLRAAAMRSAQVLNQAELARDVGISGSTAAAWLSVLQASGQIALLEPWFTNRTKSLVKRPKLYLSDTGLCAFLMGIRTMDDLLASPLVGALWETGVFAELRRHQINRHGGSDLFFWRDRTKEADFLVHRGGRFDLADAKWSEHPHPRDAMILQRVADELPAGRVDTCALVTRCANAYPIAGDVTVLPLAEAAARLAR